MAKHKKPTRPSNPLVAAILSWIEGNSDSLRLDDIQHENDPERSDGTGGFILNAGNDIPKRYSIYQPMLLLGPAFESHSPRWQSFWSNLTEDDKRGLLSTITAEFCRCGQQVTHVAVNAPISASTEAKTQNVSRSPFNLKALFGDFGPDSLLTNTSSENTDEPCNQPCQQDLERAFWVQSSQLDGIIQVWPPRWTMFSRGNLREKSRILGQPSSSLPRFPGLDAADLGQVLSRVDVVDFYVGIGYFAFSYLKRGVRRVFGWEINGWSVEGLRRGCERNGWKCLVVKMGHEVDACKTAAVEVARALELTPDLKCVVFWASNEYAVRVIDEVSRHPGTSEPLNIRHCNLGLLPSSKEVWLDSTRVLSSVNGGWVHVHENAEISQVARTEAEVVNKILSFTSNWRKQRWQVCCDHVEMVKTYAPGIGHFVFDIHIWPTDERLLVDNKPQ